MSVYGNSNWCFTLLVFTAGSLAMTPVPEHGASSSTLSNPPITCRQHFQQVSTLTETVTHRVDVSLHTCDCYLWELPPIIVADNSVGHPQTVDVAHHTLQSFRIGVISHDHSCVSHKLS